MKSFVSKTKHVDSFNGMILTPSHTSMGSDVCTSQLKIHVHTVHRIQDDQILSIVHNGQLKIW